VTFRISLSFYVKRLRDNTPTSSSLETKVQARNERCIDKQ